MFGEIQLNFWMRSGAKVCKSCRSRQELSNEYLIAKIRFDTAENEPLKVCQELTKRQNKARKNIGAGCVALPGLPDAEPAPSAPTPTPSYD